MNSNFKLQYLLVYLFWLALVVLTQGLILVGIPGIVERGLVSVNNNIISIYAFVYTASIIFALIAIYSTIFRKLVLVTGRIFGAFLALYGINLGFIGCFDFSCMFAYPITFTATAYWAVLSALVPYTLALERKPTSLSQFFRNSLKPGIFSIPLWIVLLVGFNFSTYKSLVKTLPYVIERSTNRQVVSKNQLQPSYIPTGLVKNEQKNPYVVDDGSIIWLKYNCGTIPDGLVISQASFSDKKGRADVSEMINKGKLIDNDYYDLLYYRSDFEQFRQKFGIEMPQLETVMVKGKPALYAFEKQSYSEIIHALFFDANSLKVSLRLKNQCNLTNPKDELIKIAESM